MKKKVNIYKLPKVNSWDEFYANRSWPPVPKHEQDVLFKNEFLGKYPKGTSLLEVGCGDGKWSAILSSRFKVTAIDNSANAIKEALALCKVRKINNVEFLCGDALNAEGQYDIIFARGPSFLNFPSADVRFVSNFKKLLSLCTQEVIFNIASRTPFEVWKPSGLLTPLADVDSPNSQWYHHDPEILKTNLAKLGAAHISYEKHKARIYASVKV